MMKWAHVWKVLSRWPGHGQSLEVMITIIIMTMILSITNTIIITIPSPSPQSPWLPSLLSPPSLSCPSPLSPSSLSHHQPHHQHYHHSHHSILPWSSSRVPGPQKGPQIYLLTDFQVPPIDSQESFDFSPNICLEDFSTLKKKKQKQKPVPDTREITGGLKDALKIILLIEY